MDAALFVSLCRRGPSMEEAAVSADVTVPFTACTMEPPDQPTISKTSDAPADPAVMPTVAATLAPIVASASGIRTFIKPLPPKWLLFA
jgi:hypothetical protein